MIVRVLEPGSNADSVFFAFPGDLISIAISAPVADALSVVANVSDAGYLRASYLNFAAGTVSGPHKDEICNHPYKADIVGGKRCRAAARHPEMGNLDISLKQMVIADGRPETLPNV